MATRSAQHAQDFVERMAVLLEADGLPRVAGRIFGTLLLAAEPRSLDDLASTLGVSKASISVNARLLEEKGSVERISRQADRRDYYTISEHILERSLEQRIARWRRFQETVAWARAHCGSTEPVVRARLEAMDRVYQHMLGATARALEEWRTADAAQKRPARSPARLK